jgi:hypothetical protein
MSKVVAYCGSCISEEKAKKFLIKFVFPMNT